MVTTEAITSRSTYPTESLHPGKVPGPCRIGDLRQRRPPVEDESHVPAVDVIKDGGDLHGFTYLSPTALLASDHGGRFGVEVIISRNTPEARARLL
jgi:hypothetical protein